ncbi:MAG: hypothetical protein ACOZHQ_18140 [Thermodesulfobacteriota bacterium]
MLYTTLAGRVVDTDRDLDEAGRHVVQKLMAWECLGLSTPDFAQKRSQALAVGWNGRGPVNESGLLGEVVADLIRRVAIRAGELPGPAWLRPQLWPGRYAGGGLERAGVEAGRLVLMVRDAADLERGRVVLDMPPGREVKAVLAQALAELRHGRGALAAALRGLGLGVRG